MSKVLSSTFRKLLRSAFAEASALVPSGLQPEFILAGGAALERWGRTRQTCDIDIAASVDAMAAFVEGTRLHPRFRVEVDGSIHYVAGAESSDLVGLSCAIDLLEMGDETVPYLLRRIEMGGVWVASLPELMLLKSLAFVHAREQEEVDLADVVWVVAEMERRGISYDLMQIVGLVIIS